MNSKILYKDFPILDRKVHGKKLIYLDNAATTLKPKVVVESLKDLYYFHYSNVHRGIHTLASEATNLLEGARRKIANFLNASPEEIIFTSGSTLSLNTIAHSLVKSGILKEDSKVLLTTVEHHANFVPWQRLSKIYNYKLLYAKPTGRMGAILIEDFEKFIKEEPDVVAVTGASNVTGQRLSIRRIREMFEKSILVVDGAQLVPHTKINVKELDLDFLVFSGHKMLGPTGIGVLYGKKELLEKMEPFLYGGEMIDKVTLEDTTFNILPYKFEAGTPNLAGAVGLAKAAEYLENIGMDEVENHIKELTDYAINELMKLDFVELYGPLDETQYGIISFNLDGVHPHDVAHFLDESFGIAIRTGHHCAQPLMMELSSKSRLDFPNATCRASFYVYNTKEDVDALVEGLKNVKRWLGR